MSEHIRIRRKQEKTTAVPSIQNDAVQDNAFTSQQNENEIPSTVNEVLSSSGQPLDSATRDFMEPRFGHDFSKVRVHTDERAVESAQAVDALAYTVGQDVVFGAGQYAPETGTGQQLLAHELTHTIQQTHRPQSAPSAKTSEPTSVTEREAEHAEHAIMLGQSFDVVSEVSGEIARQADAGTIQDASLPGGVSTPPSTPPSTPAEPHIVATPHGTFNVYPDNFVGPLALPDYTAGGWPVRQSVFNRIEAVVNAISGGGSITIGGTDAFKTSVLSDLAWLMTESVGLDLLQAITASGKSLTINPTSGGNSTSYTPDADSYEQPDHTQGPGANVSIDYNTAEWNPYGGIEDWMRRPPAIGLAHELVHAWSGMVGIRALGETAGVRRRELQATGLGEFSDAVYSENKFRQAFGLPLRPHY